MSFFDKLPDKLPIAIIIVAVLAALSFLHSAKEIDTEIAAAQKEKVLSDDALSRYADIDEHFGRASDQFYSSKPIVILHGNGSSESIPIYCFRNEKNISAFATNGSVGGNFGEWRGDNGKWIDLDITSKIDSGYDTIVFKNNATNEEFKVLVIVK